MINKLFLCTIILFNQLCFGESHVSLLTFTNPYILSLDGVTYMIDGVAIHDMLVVLRKIMHMQSGKKTGAKMIGNYHFNEETLSVKQLAEIERQDPNNPELKKTLTLAKNDFIETTKHFIKGIEPAKKLLLSLINEFCEKRNRPDSVILAWTHAKAGNEAHIFDQNVKSFGEFDIFLSDLTLFLKDLINSCPKARAQYTAWYTNNKQSKEA